MKCLKLKNKLLKEQKVIHYNQIDAVCEIIATFFTKIYM